MSYTYVNRCSAKVDARARGDKTYSTGKPCSNGHDSPRFVSSGNCIRCAYDRNERYRAGVEQRRKARATTRAWQKNNPGRVNAACAARKARKVSATLPGFEAQIEQIYRNCPEGYHVDHIIPLVHPLVSGLHVPWNLQYLPARENVAKKNSFDPSKWEKSFV